MFSGGYLTLMRIRGTPVRVHWSTPLVGLLITGFRFMPGVWVGVLLLVLFHELGHLFFVMRYRLHAISVDMTGFGGLCRYAGYPPPVERAIIAWGGVVFQAIIGAGALVYWLALGWPSSAFGSELVDTFLRINLMMIAFNLIPFPPLDGAEAWKLFGLMKARREAGGPREPRGEKKAKGDKAPRSAPASGPAVRVDRRADGKEVLVFDERDVESSVKEALDRAAKEARDKRKKSD